MDPAITNSAQMSEIEADTRRFGDSLPKDLTPGRSGCGLMLWDDEDHCVFLDFFGDFVLSERSRATTAALETYYGLRLPYSLRIGFHQSEEVARRTMEEWLGFDKPEADEAESHESHIHERESKNG